MTPETGSSGAAMTFDLHVGEERWCWSESLRELLGVAPDEPATTSRLFANVAHDDLAATWSAFREATRREGTFSFTFDLRDARHRLCRVVMAGHSIARDGTVEELSGFLVDITETLRANEQHAVEASSVHRAAIEQAKGALMLSFGISDEAAFEILRAESNRHNLKLAVVAQRITARLSDPVFAREDPVRSLLDILKTLPLPERPSALSPEEPAPGTSV
ncbi:ANTAR domain-containing protein [Phycicoccus sp. Soil748]|uniref:ANTAR domain-containing protein n=1 Tax=Phycicoccus sp. Soil748 TaxID=1736397 RepID=UPI000703AED7|nr:ANTAR domain-containing protein [Phycicoccus sp. Soil748]KRE53756.1 hypothetical protein ASG70_11670 [Phycicoccus sp. Soil748]